MKVVNRLSVILIIISTILIQCNQRKSKIVNDPNEFKLIQSFITIKIYLKEGKTETILTDSLNLSKLNLDINTYLLFNITTDYSNNRILIAKELPSIKTIFEFNLKDNINQVSLNVRSYDIGNTNFEDSLIFTKSKQFSLDRAYYIQHPIWNQNTICPYLIPNIDTIQLFESNINKEMCIKDFQEEFIINTLKTANNYFESLELDSSKKYYKKYLVMIKENKVDTNLIPKYVLKRLSN